MEEFYACVQSLRGLGTELGVKRDAFDRELLCGLQANRCFAPLLWSFLVRGGSREFAAGRMIEIGEFLLR